MRTKILVASALAMALAGSLTSFVQADQSFSPWVGPNGEISLPDVDYRRDWTMLGIWAIDGDDETAGVHLVYTTPDVVDAYRETGGFPDGAVLVKELRATKTDDMTTGRVSHVEELEGWFVMVKDTEERFADSGLWGDGWGWAYFDAAAPEMTTTEDYQGECISCHVPAQETDWIYVQGYPVLR